MAIHTPSPLFDGALLATWDNVVGPTCYQTWKTTGPPCPVFFEQLVPFVARCTLNGEISRENVGADTPELKFYVLNDLSQWFFVVVYVYVCVFFVFFL